MLAVARLPDGRLEIVRASPAIRNRQMLEQAIEDAIAALDACDGDPDIEFQCEDEGAACEDEGWREGS